MFDYKNILVGVGAIALATTPALLLLSNTTFINNTYNKTAHNIKPRKN